MIAPAKPDNEQERLSELYSYNILDTLPEEEFNAITRIASQVCGTPISLVTMIDADRQWFKAQHGIGGEETERDLAFCAHAILEPDDLFLVPDSGKDERFFDNPFVTGDPHVVFYAGIPLVTEKGYPLGTLCVLDSHPKELSAEQKETLKALGKQVVRLLELHKSKIDLEHNQKELRDINDELEKFAYVAAHDLKSPSNNIIGLAGILRDSAEGKLDADGMEILEHIEYASQNMKKLVDGILQHARTSHFIKLEKETFTFSELMREVRSITRIPSNIELQHKASDEPISLQKAALIQVLHNLCENAVKYNDKEQGYVNVNFSEDEQDYIFTVADNGVGIPEHARDKIFELFQTLNTTDRFDGKGTGIGLSTVKKLVEKMQGSISLSSEEGKGTTVTVRVKK